MWTIRQAVRRASGVDWAWIARWSELTNFRYEQVGLRDQSKPIWHRLFKPHCKMSEQDYLHMSKTTMILSWTMCLILRDFRLSFATAEIPRLVCATSCFSTNKHVFSFNTDVSGSRKVVSLRADLPEGRPKLAHDLSEHDAIDTTMGPNRHLVVDLVYLGGLRMDGDGKIAWPR